MKNFFHLLHWSVLVGLSAVLAGESRGADACFYLVSKGLEQKQTGTGIAVKAGDGYRFYAMVKAAEGGQINSAQLQLPNLRSQEVGAGSGPGQLALGGEFDTKQWLDSAYGKGTYVFSIHTPLDGRRTPALVLTNDAYPNVPHVSNWAAAQAINSEVPFRLTWDAFSGGKTSDYVQLIIQDSAGAEVFRSAEPAEAGALTGTARGVWIPAGQLSAGVTYKARLLFFRVISKNTAGYPGAVGWVGYYSATEFGIKTANAAGCLEFSSPYFTADKASGLASITVVRPGGAEGTVRCQYGTVLLFPPGGGHAADTEFTFTQGFLEFPPGVTSQTIQVPLNAASPATGPQTFGVNIFYPEGGASLGSVNFAEVTILDGTGMQSQFGVLKGVSLHQTNGEAAYVTSIESPYRFVSFAMPVFAGSITNAAIRTPSLRTEPLFDMGEEFRSNQGFPGKIELDRVYPNGAYRMSLWTFTDGVQSPTLNVGGDAYPNDPHVANWPAGQGITANGSFTLNWDGFVGGTSSDFIKVTIERYIEGIGRENEGVVWQTGEYWEGNALDGTATGVTIPADTFVPGVRYTGRLLFAKIVGTVTNYPGAVGYAGYFKETEFSLRTVNPAGSFDFSSVGYVVNETEPQATIMVVRSGGSVGMVSVTCNVGEVAPYRILTFPDGETAQSFTISIIDNDVLEGLKQLPLWLSDPTGGASLGEVSMGALTIIDDESLDAERVEMYMVAKGQRYRQTSDSGAYQVTAEAPFLFYGMVEPAYNRALDNVNLRSPNGKWNGLLEQGSSFGLQAMYGSKKSLDGAFTNGVYTFGFNSWYGGPMSSSIKLGTDAYPPTPRIMNWEAAHDIDALEPFTLNWAPFTGGTTNDYIHVQVYDELGGSLWGTAGMLDEEALNGLSTEAVIPEEILQAGRMYYATLTFLKRTALNTTAYPEVPGISAFFKETTFTLETSPEARPGGRLEFGAPEFSVSETGMVATITITRSRGFEGTVSVLVSTSDSTAVAGSDYASISSRVTLGENQTSAAVSVPILDDSILEKPEAIWLTLSEATGGIVGPGSNAVLRIVDNEDVRAGTIQFSTANYNVAENTAEAVITLTRTGASNRMVSVSYATADDTAIADADYGATNGVVVFGPGQTKKTFRVPILDNTYVDGTRNVRLLLSEPSGGASFGSRSNAVLSIVNDDVGGVISFKTNVFIVGETNLQVILTLVRTGGFASEVTVQFSLSDGTATAGQDYRNLSGQLVFHAGEASKTFAIQLIRDVVAEGDETVNLMLINPTGGSRLGISNAVMRIVDDEVGFRLSQSSYTVGEGATTASVVVQRTGPNNRADTVDFVMEPGTAIPGQDYTNVSRHLTFNTGVSSMTIKVPLANDTVADGEKTVLLSLTNGSAGTILGNNSNAVLTITDNDQAGVISFSAAAYSVSETNHHAVVTLTRTGGVASGVTVDLSLSNGTATFGEDYTNNLIAVTFAAGQTSKTVWVLMQNDSQVEPDETIMLNLGNPTGGATLGTQVDAVLTVRDDESRRR